VVEPASRSVAMDLRTAPESHGSLGPLSSNRLLGPNSFLLPFDWHPIWAELPGRHRRVFRNRALPIGRFYSRQSSSVPLSSQTARDRTGNFGCSAAKLALNCDCVNRCVCRLYPQPTATSYRRLVERRRRSDASIKEIAEEAGITVAATKSISS
jgi:hypothetical protein